MKKFLIAFLAVFCISIAARADKYTLDRSQLPQPAQEMIAKYFPKAKIAMIKVDKHLLKKTDYDVKLVNGTKIEFNNAGKWTSVDCKKKEVPQELVIRSIRNYVKNNGNGAYIVKVENSFKGYEIELSDGVELKFSKLGKLKGIDMKD